MTFATINKGHRAFAQIETRGLRASSDALDRITAQQRAELGEERWAELQREWGA